MNRFRSIAMVVAAGLVLVACGASSPSPSSAGESQAAASQGQPSQAQASQGGPEASFSQGIAADLEAMIPDTVGAITLQKTSMRGNDYLINPDSDPDTVQFLNDLGVSPSDVSMAFGFGSDTSTGDFLVMFVTRAAGADGNRLKTAFKNATAGDASPMAWTQATISGKQVETAATDSGTTYLYAVNDVVIFLTTTNPDTAAQIIGDLP